MDPDKSSESLPAVTPDDRGARGPWRGIDHVEVAWSDEIPGTVRCHLHDPFGNRIELIEADGGEEAR